MDDKPELTQEDATQFRDALVGARFAFNSFVSSNDDQALERLRNLKASMKNLEAIVDSINPDDVEFDDPTDEELELSGQSGEVL